jgi:hypothetical protein
LLPFYRWEFEHEGRAMKGKKPAAAKPPTPVVGNDPDDLKGALKHIGGSKSDRWNRLLANQTVQSLWLKHSDNEMLGRQLSATLASLAGIGPRDELEGMMAAQLIAAHSAAMECSTAAPCSASRPSRGGETISARPTSYRARMQR